MRRILTLVSVIAVSAWAGAQNPTPLAAEHLKQFQSNRELLEDLVGRSVELANANSPLDRARSCQKATTDLTRALNNAIRADDADRIVELCDYLATILDHGVTPALTDAQREMPAGSPGAADLATLLLNAKREAERAETAIPTTGKLGTAPQIQSARQLLSAAKSRLPRE